MDSAKGNPGPRGFAVQRAMHASHRTPSRTSPPSSSLRSQQLAAQQRARTLVASVQSQLAQSATRHLLHFQQIPGGASGAEPSDGMRGAPGTQGSDSRTRAANRSPLRPSSKTEGTVRRLFASARSRTADVFDDAATAGWSR
ncbi:hypothetical protein [Actinomadura atramentaria]|uniref:hypothetical protein n=1 Tax=Actinomadura atramentaria TaxID=1990 RepID=UPI0003A76528|nr:hypothetical protein [Actinomadura atramentaria]